MKINYKNADGVEIEVEVSEEVGIFIIDSDRMQSNADRKERAHCFSLDAIDFEGNEYGMEDDYGEPTDEQLRVREALSRLTETQRRRLQMVADGLTYREIALIEGVDYRVIGKSIAAARKKFLDFYK